MCDAVCLPEFRKLDLFSSSGEKEERFSLFWKASRKLFEELKALDNTGSKRKAVIHVTGRGGL
jgi:hypothetical protein